MSKEVNLIEGERGKLHVTSDDARTENALIFGTGRKVLNIDSSFSATMLTGNTVRIASGVFYNNGMFIRINRDQYVEINIDSGLAGTYRHDLICIRYERNIQTQLESASIVVKKGVTSETSAVDPAYEEGNVLDLREHLDEFPLYRVSLDGVAVTLTPLFTVEDALDNISLYNELISHLQDEDNPAGNKHIPAGGGKNQVLCWSKDGVAEWKTAPVSNKALRVEVHHTGTGTAYPVLLAGPGAKEGGDVSTFFSDVTYNALEKILNVTVTNANRAISDGNGNAIETTYATKKELEEVSSNIPDGTPNLVMRIEESESGGGHPILFSQPPTENGDGTGTYSEETEVMYSPGATYTPDTNTLDVNISGNAATADSAIEATYATVAGYDIDGNDIVAAYATKDELNRASSDGSTHNHDNTYAKLTNVNKIENSLYGTLITDGSIGNNNSIGLYATYEEGKAYRVEIVNGNSGETRNIITLDGTIEEVETDEYTVRAHVAYGTEMTVWVARKDNDFCYNVALYEAGLDALPETKANVDGSNVGGTWNIDILGNAKTVNGRTVNADVPSGAKFTDTTYSAATQSAQGLMSAADKKKLDGIATGANAYSHPNSGVTAGTYRNVTVNAQGHVTGGSNPTITVAQGGTGASNAATARSNLGITPANIGAANSNHTHSYLPLSGGTMSGNLNIANGEGGIWFENNSEYYEYEFFEYNCNSFSTVGMDGVLIGSGNSDRNNTVIPSALKVHGDTDIYGGFNVWYYGVANIYCSLDVHSDLNVYGTKSRVTETENYNKRKLYCYEMSSPIFGDIGHGVTDDDGLCYIDLDSIFAETIDLDCEYYIFLQSYSENNVYVLEKHQTFFIIKGEPNTEFDWEVKAKQLGYSETRLEECVTEEKTEQTETVESDNETIDENSEELGGN